MEQCICYAYVLETGFKQARSTTSIYSALLGARCYCDIKDEKDEKRNVLSSYYVTRHFTSIILVDLHVNL